MIELAIIEWKNGATTKYTLVQGPKLWFVNEQGDIIGDGTDIRRNAKEYAGVKVIATYIYHHGYVGTWHDELVMVNEKSFKAAVRKYKKRIAK